MYPFIIHSSPKNPSHTFNRFVPSAPTRSILATKTQHFFVYLIIVCFVTLTGCSIGQEELDSKLALAFEEEEYDEAARLLEKGASPNVMVGTAPILVEAVKLRLFDLAKALLDHGADPDGADDELVSALVHAAEAGDTKMMRLLLDSGAATGAAEADLSGAVLSGLALSGLALSGKTPLLVAVSAGRPMVEAVRLLLERGADVNVTDGDGVSALMTATVSGEQRLVELLLDHGADPDGTDVDGRTPLTVATGEGRRGIAALLLARGADPLLAPEGAAPLVLAVERAVGEEDLLLIKLLLESGADAASSDSRGRTVIEIARERVVEAVVAESTAAESTTMGESHREVYGGHIPIINEVVLLLEAAQMRALHMEKELTRAFLAGERERVEELLLGGANPEALFEDGSTLLLRSVLAGDKALVRLVLEKGADPDRGGVAGGDTKEGGETPLAAAVASDAWEISALLLDKGADPAVYVTVLHEHHKGVGYHGTPVLNEAARQGAADVVEMLLKKGAPVGAADLYYNRTAIMEAAAAGRAEVVLLLIDSGADVDVRPVEGTSAPSPLYLAASGGHVKVVRLLLERGADAGYADEDGKTSLLKADSAPVARLLLEYGADPNVSGIGGYTPLMKAVRGGDAVLTRVLLEHGADPAARDMYGWVTLMGAAEKGDVALAELLLDHGAKADVADESGETPLTLAAMGGDMELARLLLDRGADALKRNWAGKTAAEIAEENGHRKLAKLLAGE